MKKVLALSVILAFSASSIIGCSPAIQSYVLDSGHIAVEASVLKNKYSNVEQLLRNTQEKKKMFSDAEWRQLLNVDATIDMLVMRYDAISKFEMKEISVSDVKFMWGLATEGYRQASEVVTAHWDEFEPSQKIMLNAYDKEAHDINDKIEKLINNPSNENINNAVTLIAGVLNVAIKILGKAVL